VKIAGTLMGKREESRGIMDKVEDELHQENQGISSVLKMLPIPCRTDFKSVVSPFHHPGMDGKSITYGLSVFP